MDQLLKQAAIAQLRGENQFSELLYDMVKEAVIAVERQKEAANVMLLDEDY